jgi:eukaryotic-like serine/threonine-protein kinase
VNTSCPRCGLSVPEHALGACPRCLLADLDEPEPLPENPYGLELLEEIGRGGMGRVFRARHARLDRLVAVKLLPAELAVDLAFRARFEREARTLARLSHPHIVTVHDFGALADGAGYLVMEFVAGGTLRQRLPLSASAAERVTRELANALVYAHAQGVVHRDIKPENVLFDSEGRARLADFGIARLLADEHATLTAPHIVLGTPRYMAPEARSGAATDTRVDLFSLGVMLQEMLGDLDDARLSAIAARARATDLSQRFPSAVALLNALDGRDTPALDALPADERSWVRAVALTLAGATAVSLYAMLVSVTPRVLQAGEALPLITFDVERRGDGRLLTRARFETWPTLAAVAAWAVAFVAYALLRGHWRRTGLEVHSPEQPLEVVRPALRLALGLNALFAVHLLIEGTTLRHWVSYIPILGGVLELAMVYLLWVAVLDAWRTSRPLRREPLLWVAAAISLIPPAVSSIRLWQDGAP